MRFRRRLVLLYAGFAVGLCLIWLRTLQMQTIDGDYWAERAQRARQMERVLEAPRGRILDANGVVLARDEATLQLVVVPWAFERRRRVKCHACGLVSFLSARGRVPKRCRCQSTRREFASLGAAHTSPSITELPEGDLRPLEEALGMSPGRLEELAQKRLDQIDVVVDRFVNLMEAQGKLEFFRKDHEDSLAADLKRRPFVLQTGVPDEAARLVLLDEEGAFRGFDIQTDLRRFYPEGDLAPRLLGYVTKVRDEDEYRTLRAKHRDGAVTRNTRVGRTGLERAFNWHLHGRPGSQRLARDHNGSFTEVVEHKPPLPGSDLHLSLDTAACRRASQVLTQYATREQYLPNARPSGGFVMLDAETGEILVWSEIPTFDLNEDLHELYDEKLTKVRKDRENRQWLPGEDLPDGMDLAMFQERVDAPAPLALSRNAQIGVEPGSTFKTLVALGLLHTNHLDAGMSFTCSHGMRYKPGCHACGTVDLEMALIRSCNRYFAWYLRDNKHSPWSARRRDMGAFLRNIGIGRSPSGAFHEWTAGTFGDAGYDFTLSGVVQAVHKTLVDEHAQAAEHAAAIGQAPPPAPPRLEITFDRACPDVVGGRPEKIRQRLLEMVRRVTDMSAAPILLVQVGLEDRTERQLQLRFSVRPSGMARWTSLPGAALEGLPDAWKRALAHERMGFSGNPARGGAVWMRARVDRPSGRKSPSDSPVLHDHDGRNLGIGQGPVLVTPMHMARAMAAIANGGVLVTPHAVKAIGDHPHREPRRALGVRTAHLEAVRAGMLGVVDHPRGTAYGKGFDAVAATVYGKTGTAQLGGTWRPWGNEGPQDEAWHHWFVGFAEAPGRRTVAFACVLHARQEQAAGKTAARAAAAILKDWFNR